MAEDKKKKSNLVYGKDDEEISLETSREHLKKRGINPDEEKSFSKSIINVLNGQGSIERLAFEADPSQVNNYAGVYRSKVRLIPDTILKRIAIQDSLVSNIVRARQNHISSFGRPRPDRFSLGFIIKPNTGLLDKLDEKGKEDLQKEIKDAIDLLSTCGHTKGIRDEHQATFAEYLSLSARSAIVCGRIATEVVWIVDEKNTDKKKFHHFLATDSGTIYPATHDEEALEAVRKEAYNLLCRITGQKLIPEKFNNNDYVWVQVIDGSPKQVFTTEEMLVYNFYSVPDVELGGFPVSPLDTVISAVTTHINITTLNKLWFQNGRATKGMLVIKSEDANPSTIHTIKQNFNASINNVNNAFRLPVFGCGVDEEINWQPLDTGAGRDMEFEYLCDLNAREILTAFMMSPDELPGWSYLSRGTNNQALSECIASNSRVLTKEGLVEVGKYIGSGEEKRGAIWSGDKWGEGRVFRSGVKKLIETELNCGIKLNTSPDHRFRIIDDNGELGWKHQSELKVGEQVLVNRKPVKGDESLLPIFNGRKLTPAVMEVLGWMTGDGCLVADRKRSGSVIHLFYHSEKERDIWEKHKEILEDWGLVVSHDEEFRSDKDKEKIKGLYGFKSVAPSKIKNKIYDTNFYRWLVEFGFQPSSRGEKSKVVPNLLHVLPVPYRQAFLKGLFSADGGKLNKTGSVALTIQNDQLRDQVRQLLMGLGIRVLPCKGLLRESFGKKKYSNKLFVKDRAAFWEQVGFIQAWKQPDKIIEKWTVDAPPLPIVEKCLRPCLGTVGFKNLSKGVRDSVVCLLKGKKGSYQFLGRIMDSCGVSPPSWFYDYYMEPIASIRDLGKTVEMYDVEMYDDVHAFTVDGVVTHNSNNEYKLQAARDVGIRPLLSGFEDFVNSHLFPLIAPNLADKCRVNFVGLEADNAEKEAVRTQQDMGIWMTFDEVLERVEKKAVGKEWGGTLPLNQIYKSYLDQYFTVGEILEKFCGRENASKDPALAYRRDPMFFQWYQLQMQAQQMQQQAQAQQQQQAQGGQGQSQGQSQGGQDSQPQTSEDPTQAGGQPPSGANAYGQQTEKEKSQQDSSAEGSGSSPSSQGASDLARSIDQAYELLQKKESQLPPDKRKLIAQQEKTVEFFTKGWNQDVDEALKVILGIAEHHTPKAKA